MNSKPRKPAKAKRPEARITPGSAYGDVHRGGCHITRDWAPVDADAIPALVAAVDQHGRALVEVRTPK
jgi:hypothetical protein